MVANFYKEVVVQLFESLHRFFSAFLEKAHQPGLFAPHSGPEELSVYFLHLIVLLTLSENLLGAGHLIRSQKITGVLTDLEEAHSLVGEAGK